MFNRILIILALLISSSVFCQTKDFEEWTEIEKKTA